ncbi:hypothetical protein J1605_016969 [Eschrichtius robustus]|uniref:Uncharacterized protein n=1 Tax=Eschrichtius robustus TaxID=9764 RepID=A0AB34I3G1_ESCRO|nr:hypothetical protein J1605_016969 [Eschrichtius robustus]
MERRSQKRSRSGTRLVPVSRPAEPRGAKLWLFPHRLRAPQRAVPEDRGNAPEVLHAQLLAVLERDGADVEAHQLPVGSDGPGKPKCIVREKNDDTFCGS